MPSLFGSSSQSSQSASKRLSFQKRDSSPTKVFHVTQQSIASSRGRRLLNQQPISPPSPPLQDWLPHHESLNVYQVTIDLIHKLYTFPGFDRYLFPEGVDLLLKKTDMGVIDPISVLWGFFRLGAPLCALFNHLELPQSKSRLPVPDVQGLTRYNNSCKRSIYLFLVACKDELGLPENHLFTVSDIYKDDTNGLLKAMKTVNIVLHELDKRGKLSKSLSRLPFWNTPSDGDSSLTVSSESPDFSRRCAIQELIQTERKYAASLQYLQSYRNEVKANRLINPDGMHAIFSDLDRVIDFETRFLIALESILSLPSHEQRIGALFCSYEEAFGVYAPMCGNYDRATRTIQLYGHVLSQIKTMEPYRELQSYLIKPVQRICQYPLILEEILKYSDRNTDPHYHELEEGIAAMRRVTERINEAKRFEENKKMKEDLLRNISDWKGLEPATFGNLLLRDSFVIRTVEKEYVLYLFENALICCKYANRKESSKRDSKIDEAHLIYKDKIAIDAIYQVFDLSRPVENIFELRIDWMDGSNRETFRLKCRNHEQAKMWCQRLETHVNHLRSGYGSLMRRQLTVNTSLPPKSPARSSSVTPNRTNVILTAPPLTTSTSFPFISPAASPVPHSSSAMSPSSTSVNSIYPTASSNPIPFSLSYAPPPYPSPVTNSSFGTPSLPSSSLNRSSFASSAVSAHLSSLDRKSIASAESMSRLRQVQSLAAMSNPTFASLAKNRMSTTSRVLFDIDKVLSTEFDGIDLSPEDKDASNGEAVEAPDEVKSSSVPNPPVTNLPSPYPSASSTRRQRRDPYQFPPNDQFTMNESRVMLSLMNIAEAEEERQYEDTSTEMRPVSASSTSSAPQIKSTPKRELAFRGPRLRMPSADDVVFAKETAPQSAPVSGPFGGHIRTRTHGPILVTPTTADSCPQQVVIETPLDIPTSFSATIVQEPE